jgi:outer membrane protein TolC
MPRFTRWFAAACALTLGATAATAMTSLSLPFCLGAALQFNRELVQARSRIDQVRGERTVVRSRFLPQIDLQAAFDAERNELDTDAGDGLSSSLRFSQRLFEFGPDALAEINLRDDLRQAVYAYREQSYTVLARVWELFHIILLQDEQIAIRRQSRQNFHQTFLRQEARFARRLATEEEKLSAELNVLNEDLAINDLVREQFNNKMELLRLIGQPIGSEIRPTGPLGPFTLSQDEAVELAVANSVDLSLATERMQEQQRVLAEIKWDYAPDLSLDAGVEDDRRRAAVQLRRDGSVWGADLSSEFDLNENAATVEPRRETRFYSRIEARVPIFAGGRRLGREAAARARLRQFEVQLDDRRAALELQVRQAYQSMLQAERQQSIQSQRVYIARRRLEINQILKEKGQADESKFEQVRNDFFNTQNALFGNQANFIRRQANLRRLMGYLQ